MESCTLCGANERLVEAIGSSEIIRVCLRCANGNNMPIIRKANSDQLRDMSRFQSVVDGISESKTIKKEKDPETAKLEEELKGIVKENLHAGNYDDLIDNFHWHIQQARRRMKISPKQLGEAVAESDVIIEMAEKSQLPENYQKLISKLEQYLGIKLRKGESKATGITDKGFDLKKADTLNVTTGELKAHNQKPIKDEEKLRKALEEQFMKEISEKVKIVNDEDESKAL